MYATRLRSDGDPAGSPSTRTLPPATICTPTIARMSVDLPLPLGPSSPVTRPAAISAESPGSTTRSPRTTRRSLTSIAATARRLRSFPMAIPVFSRAHVEAAVSPERALEAVRDAFVAYARGEWTMPPKVYVPAYPAGDFRAMPALGARHALLKWVTSFPGNPARGLPTVTGVVLVSNAETGMLEAVLDAASVTALRTGAAAVLAAEMLGRAGGATTSVVGAGVNGRAAARTFLARGRDVTLWDVDPARAAAAAANVGASLAETREEAL